MPFSMSAPSLATAPWEVSEGLSQGPAPASRTEWRPVAPSGRCVHWSSSRNLLTVCGFLETCEVSDFKGDQNGTKIVPNLHRLCNFLSIVTTIYGVVWWNSATWDWPSERFLFSSSRPHISPLMGRQPRLDQNAFPPKDSEKK